MPDFSRKTMETIKQWIINFKCRKELAINLGRTSFKLRHTKDTFKQEKSGRIITNNHTHTHTITGSSSCRREI